VNPDVCIHVNPLSSENYDCSPSHRSCYWEDKTVSVWRYFPRGRAIRRIAMCRLRLGDRRVAPYVYRYAKQKRVDQILRANNARVRIRGWAVTERAYDMDPPPVVSWSMPDPTGPELGDQPADRGLAQCIQSVGIGE